jgi:hypothetical protein
MVLGVSKESTLRGIHRGLNTQAAGILRRALIIRLPAVLLLLIRLLVIRKSLLILKPLANRLALRTRGVLWLGCYNGWQLTTSTVKNG